jgi:hypothetical protein
MAIDSGTGRRRVRVTNAGAAETAGLSAARPSGHAWAGTGAGRHSPQLAAHHVCAILVAAQSAADSDAAHAAHDGLWSEQPDGAADSTARGASRLGLSTEAGCDVTDVSPGSSTPKPGASDGDADGPGPGTGVAAGAWKATGGCVGGGTADGGTEDTAAGGTSGGSVGGGDDQTGARVHLHT